MGVIASVLGDVYDGHIEKVGKFRSLEDVLGLRTTGKYSGS